MHRGLFARFVVILLVVLCLAGCGDSTPSLIGKWQNVSGGSVGTYGGVIEFIDGSNVNLGQSAATYSIIDATHLKLTDPTTSAILDMKLDNDRLTLASNGLPSTFVRVTGNALPLAKTPSPVAGKWRFASSDGMSSYTFDFGEVHADPGSVVQFTGTAVGGMVIAGASRAPYTVKDPTHISTSASLFGDSFTIALKTRDKLVLKESPIFGGITYTFTQAG